MSKSPIFITGRFRSGTSFLWQLFNHLDGYCAWYEPLHPHLLNAIQHVEPKKDHIGIKDYWQSYRLKPEFESAYSMQFATQQLYLEAGDEYIELEAYINKLINLSESDVPVLQFNRVDLRLPWLKSKFPEAKIIHIERNPLQLYYSQRKHIGSSHQNAVHYWDAYELMPWCHSLQPHFPFLLSTKKNHAFYQFYVIYQLSKLIAEEHCDVSINLDSQVFQSEEFISQLSKVVNLSQTHKTQIKNMTHVPPEPPIFDDTLSNDLAEIMTDVDLKLTAAGLMDELGKSSLKNIRSKYYSFWQVYGDMISSNEIQPTSNLLLSVNQLSSELTRILAENKQLKEQVNFLKADLRSKSDDINSEFKVDQNE